MVVKKTLMLIVIMCMTYVTVDVESRRPRLRADPTKPPRDYRPSKWLSNSAMDVWYGNKSLVEILSREFKDVVDKLALRPVRASSVSSGSGNEKRKIIVDNWNSEGVSNKAQRIYPNVQ